MVTMYDVTCSRCGKAGEVPFKPKADKPVYCKACYRATAGGRTEPDAQSGAEKSISKAAECGACLVDITGLTIPQRVFVAAAIDMFKSQAS